MTAADAVIDRVYKGAVYRVSCSPKGRSAVIATDRELIPREGGSLFQH
jgi:hypothetical protein